MVLEAAGIETFIRSDDCGGTCPHLWMGGVDSAASYIEILENEQWKLLSYSNGYNFSLGGPIQAHNISRHSKLNNGSSREIQMVLTFNSKV